MKMRHPHSPPRPFPVRPVLRRLVGLMVVLAITMIVGELVTGSMFGGSAWLEITLLVMLCGVTFLHGAWAAWRGE